MISSKKLFLSVFISIGFDGLEIDSSNASASYSIKHSVFTATSKSSDKRFNISVFGTVSPVFRCDTA